MSDILRVFQSGINQRNRNHPDTVLNARWEHGYFWEYALIRSAGKNLVRVSFGTAIGANDSDGWSKIFDEMPAGASDCEQIHIVTDMTQHLNSCMMLE